MSNALLTLIRASSGDRSAMRAEFVSAFSSDLDELIKANNKDSLTRALQAVGKGEKWQALTVAINAGLSVAAGILPDGAGWIGAKFGPFAKADKEARAPYLLARAAGVDAFTDSLESSVHWRDITEADKAKAKAEREAKKAEREALEKEEKAKSVQAEIDARVSSGELVKRESVRLLSDYNATALIDALSSLPLSGDDIEALQALIESAKKAQQVAA